LRELGFFTRRGELRFAGVHGWSMESGDLDSSASHGLRRFGDSPLLGALRFGADSSLGNGLGLSNVRKSGRSSSSIASFPDAVSGTGSCRALGLVARSGELRFAGVHGWAMESGFLDSTASHGLRRFGDSPLLGALRFGDRRASPLPKVAIYLPGFLPAPRPDPFCCWVSGSWKQAPGKSSVARMKYFCASSTP
jgi:hypothetical protein